MSSRNIGADCSRSTGSIVSTLIDIRTLPQTLISHIVVADLLFNLEPDKRFVETYYSAKVHLQILQSRQNYLFNLFS